MLRIEISLWALRNAILRKFGWPCRGPFKNAVACNYHRRWARLTDMDCTVYPLIDGKPGAAVDVPGLRSITVDWGTPEHDDNWASGFKKTGEPTEFQRRYMELTSQWEGHQEWQQSDREDADYLSNIPPHFHGKYATDDWDGPQPTYVDWRIAGPNHYGEDIYKVLDVRGKEPAWRWATSFESAEIRKLRKERGEQTYDVDFDFSRLEREL